MKVKIVVNILLFFLFTLSVYSQQQAIIPQEKIKFYQDVLKYGTEEEVLKVLKELIIYDNSPLLQELLYLLGNSPKTSIKVGVLNCIKSLKNSKNAIKPLLERLLKDEFLDNSIISIAVLSVGELEIKELEDTVYTIFMKEEFKDNIAIRRNALIALGKLQAEKYQKTLFGFLLDSKNNDELRSYTALYFAEFNAMNPEYVKKFNEIAIDPAENTYVRRYILYALSKYRDPSSYDFVIKALADDDPYVQIYAARALKNYDITKAIKILLEVLRSNNASVRVEILKIFIDLKNVETIEAVIFKGMHDKDNNVRKEARKAFIAIIEANKTAIPEQYKQQIIEMLSYLAKYDMDETIRQKSQMLLLSIFNIKS